MNGSFQYPFTLEDPSAKLSATLFLPQGKEVRTVLLFLLPLMEERKGSLPLIVHAARTWAAEEEIASIFFDYSGCGDSSGDFCGATPEQLQEDTGKVLQWIQEHFQKIPVCIVATRIAALIALKLAERHENCLAGLVLWSPITGQAFLKQLFQRRMVNDMVAYGKARESRKQLEAALNGGRTIDLDGFPLTPALYTWLQTPFSALCNQPVNLPTCIVSGGQDRFPAEQILPADVEKIEIHYPPFWNTVGQVDLAALIRATERWITRRFPQTTPCFPLPSLPQAPDFPVLTDTEGRTIRLALDRQRGKPVGGILFLHGWSGDRTGPHRLFTRAGRSFAEEGYLCARLDFTGRGCSDGCAEEASIAQMVRDAEKAMRFLQGSLPSQSPVIVVAICSGCKVAITLASRHPEIHRLILWSAESMGSLRHPATGVRKTLHSIRIYLQKAFKAETWAKLLTGKINTKLVTKALVRHETRSAQEAEEEDRTLKRFRTFSHPLLFLYGGSDPDAAGSGEAYAGFCTRNKIPYRLHTIPHAGHSYYSEEWSGIVLEKSLHFLRDG